MVFLPTPVASSRIRRSTPATPGPYRRRADDGVARRHDGHALRAPNRSYAQRHAVGPSPGRARGPDHREMHLRAVPLPDRSRGRRREPLTPATATEGDSRIIPGVTSISADPGQVLDSADALPVIGARPADACPNRAAGDDSPPRRGALHANDDGRPVPNPGELFLGHGRDFAGGCRASILHDSPPGSGGRIVCGRSSDVACYRRAPAPPVDHTDALLRVVNREGRLTIRRHGRP